MTSDLTASPAPGLCRFWLLVARRDHRERLSLFHSALRVRLRGATSVVEMAPARSPGESDRGVVREGPVGAGDMANSSSVVAWLLTRVGLGGEAVVPPRHGRAPGWRAGVEVSLRQADGPALGIPTRADVDAMVAHRERA